jgi:GT2 family glycosyltransferase/2-polyprenyl-3-methyl-5-hydroxy-6-metoxy-1,4-benzoquinol methylase
MPQEIPELHVYERDVLDQDNDSLSLLARRIGPGAFVLDLGMGTGGLGRYLAARQALTIDGVTLSADEAQRAGSTYRHVVVADLDSADLCQLFAGQRYDRIVCADVLEHLKNPERILQQCRQLLQPGGQLLTSVPNVAYCGLLAELIQGDFRYRPEGLLDNTHLRFFTRQSLQRFFAAYGWDILSSQTTTRDVLSSEFHGPFNLLPPAVSRHLLSLPDASTYQFICSLVPLPPGQSASPHPTPDSPPAQALFSAQLYPAIDGNYDEARKQVRPGTMGGGVQTLRFAMPPLSDGRYTRVRLDPADRPGFMRLVGLRVLTPNNPNPLWAWQADTSSHSALENAPQQQISWSPPWGPSNQCWLQLLGDDPWLELPLDADTLQTLTRQGGTLEMHATWPMSADYLQANQNLQAVEVTHAQQLAHIQAQTQDQLQSENQRHAQQLAHLQAQTQEQLQSETQRHAQLQAQLQAQMQDQLQAHRQEVVQLQSTIATGQHNQTQLQQTLQQASLDKSGLLQKLGQLRSEVQDTQEQIHESRQQLHNAQAHIERIENTKLFRWTRPLAHAKYTLDGWLGRHTPAPIEPTHTLHLMTAPPDSALAQPLPGTPVDVIVPVYRGLEDTQRCILSALASPCQTDWHLVVINDCSPEPEVSQWLREVAAQEPRITLLENEENLGFVATVNRGMRLHPDRDVLLLNSDTEVANDWLDRIQRAAYAQPQVASVTPFSNNATICSYPRFCEANDLPAGHTTASLDQLFAQHLAGHAVAVPTGVGFCMYIRRACLQEIGAFDEEHFGKGYGEENDFCIRAHYAGWTNLHLLDTFVRHVGGISFGDSKSERELNAMRTLAKLHPRYDSDVHHFIGRDPAQWARRVIDVARITCSGKPVILNVMHNREGGTLRHLQEMGEHLAEHATFLRLSPAPGGVTLRLEGEYDKLSLHFNLPQEQDHLVQTLQRLQVAHIHYHHLLGHTPFISQLPELLGLAHDFTLHDYYSYCPQISLTDETHRYCGEKGIEQCRQCVQRNPAPGGLDIQAWRDQYTPMLGQARTVISPSADAGQRLLQVMPLAKVQVVPHSRLLAQPAQHPTPEPAPLQPTQRLKIVVLGGLSQIKGADVVEALAVLAAKQNTPIDIHLIGFAYRQLRTQPHARLTVHGPYADQDLPQLLDWLQADVAWFPALWPETYSYTLSACLEKGLPIVAPALGAFAERLAQRPWSWLTDWDQTPAQWAAFFEHIHRTHFITGQSPSPQLPPSFSSPMGHDFDYRQQYLQGLRIPTPPSADELAQMAHDICHAPAPATGPAQTSKSLALRLLQKLKSAPLLAPLVKALPLPLQRRTKSWLMR